MNDDSRLRIGEAKRFRGTYNLRPKASWASSGVWPFSEDYGKFPVRYMDGSVASGFFSFLMNYACHRKGTAWYLGVLCELGVREIQISRFKCMFPLYFFKCPLLFSLRDPVSELL